MAKGEASKKPDKAGLGDVLFEPEGGKAEVDIIFVHGLGGDRIETWTWRDKTEKTFWPKDLLPKDCPTARILSFGYNADFAKFYPDNAETIAPELTIDDYSTSLLEALKVLRGDTDSNRPIIFVAHSMGGLVVANALSRSYGTDVAKQGIADQTIGTLFLGTPFEGSAKAKYASIALAIVKYVLVTQPASLSDLEERSRKLTDINHSFAQFLQRRDRSQDKPHLEVACFFEERPMRKPMGFIVPKESATWLGVDAQSIQANHVGMCKFEDEFGSDYKSVAGKLSQWVKDIEKNKKADKKGGVGGVNAESIGVVMGDVDNRGVYNHQGLVMGHAYGTSENANRFIGHIGSVSYGNNQPPASGGLL
ncbi:hypothetical protein F5Y19DRAFT_461965 [Xylariaceae sp. FL1651]|nr:hypothetical protein F5Y19DRAFT_461965 [Xylariaceae sp. FL1651]